MVVFKQVSAHKVITGLATSVVITLQTVGGILYILVSVVTFFDAQFTKYWQKFCCLSASRRTGEKRTKNEFKVRQLQFGEIYWLAID